MDSSSRVRLLIVSTDMHIGGVTSALIAFLNSLDYERFDADLLLYGNDGPWQEYIPPMVRVLPQANTASGIKGLARKLLSVKYVAGRARAFALEKILNRPMEGLQVRSRVGSRYAGRLTARYDLAISFIEFWPLYYTAFYVKARHKLAWIHVDYKNCNLSVKKDMCAYPFYDRIVMVSEECARNFADICPGYAEKAVYLPNIVSASAVRERAKSACGIILDKGTVRLVTVARVQFVHKGLDRGVLAFDALRRAGMLEGVVWYIIGDGADLARLNELISSLGRENEIITLGAALNPLPMVKQCDAFVLTSRYEGKPIAVTEAMILGLPALVTEYASAREQVEDGVDGIIAENSREGIEKGLKELCEVPGKLDSLKREVRARHYGNESDIEKYYELWREIGVAGCPR